MFLQDIILIIMAVLLEEDHLEMIIIIVSNQTLSWQGMSPVNKLLEEIFIVKLSFQSSGSK